MAHRRIRNAGKRSKSRPPKTVRVGTKTYREVGLDEKVTLDPEGTNFITVKKDGSEVKRFRAIPPKPNLDRYMGLPPTASGPLFGEEIVEVDRERYNVARTVLRPGHRPLEVPPKFEGQLDATFGPDVHGQLRRKLSYAEDEYQLGVTETGRPFVRVTDWITTDMERLLRNRQMIQRHHLHGLVEKAERADLGPEAAVAHLIRSSEWFNFGHIEDGVIASEGYDAISLVGSGMLHLPYNSCMLTHSYDDPVTGIFVQAFYLVSEGLGAEIPIGSWGIMEFRLAIKPDGVMTFNPNIALTTDFKRRPEDNKYQMRILSNPQRLDGNELYLEAESACNPVALMILALNTKNLRIEKVAAPEKLNKARARNGKPPIYHYTRVYLHHYLEAAKETRRMEAKGTHASPRPHLRRGHFRYKNHDRIQPKWIGQCIVNAHMQEAPLTREEYKVRK